MKPACDPMPLAESALLWLLAEPERAGGFLGASGLDVSALRARANEPAMLGFVLDYILSEDAWVLSFAEESGYDPASVAVARAGLPGGEVPHWT